MKLQSCPYFIDCKANRCPTLNPEECQLGAYYRRIDIRLNEERQRIRELEGNFEQVEGMDS